MAEFFRLARANEVVFMGRLPRGGGWGGGGIPGEGRFAERDPRHYNRRGEAFSQGETFSGVPFERAIELVERDGRTPPLPRLPPTVGSTVAAGTARDDGRGHTDRTAQQPPGHPENAEREPDDEPHQRVSCHSDPASTRRQ